MPRDLDRVVIWDRGERPAVLPVAWSVGGAFHRGVSYGVDSWAEARHVLTRHRQDRGPVRTLQFWHHGTRQGPAMSGKVLRIRALAELARAAGEDLEIVAFRSCLAARNHVFMVHAARAFGCPVAGHTQVTNPRFPWMTQRGFVILRPGEVPTWDVDFDDPRAVVSTLRMNFDPRTASSQRAWRAGRVWRMP